MYFPTLFDRRLCSWSKNLKLSKLFQDEKVKVAINGDQYHNSYKEFKIKKLNTNPWSS